MTSFKLLCQIMLSMRMTNLSAQFSQEIIWMLNFNILYDVEVFIDDIEIKKLKMKYDNKKNLSEVHYFILEYLQILDHVLLILKLINIKIFKEKSHFNQSEIIIIKFLYDYKRRYSKITKITKIVNWLSCKNIMKVRVFIKVYIYYWIWIKNFIIII